ncbi:MAG TPA: hypothetical protein VMR06_10405 [Dokdonella sp.]|uniref:hypothetical protein n=1 Tax=Dokdonella sp. TaxID=2291710 RepID=UPI002C9C091A|nr:hypothetical protein [Dokdonella sp.]HUD42390.1 hypothetical protein [Dokdonella sp.]
MSPTIRCALSFLALAAVAFAAPARADARDAVLAAHRATMDARVRVETVSSAGGQQARSTVRYDTSRRVHLKTDRMEMIVLPEGIWMRNGDGGWTKPPFDASALVRQLVPETVEQMQKGLSNVVDEGPATFGGQPARAYSFDVAMTMMGISVNSRSRILVGADGRIVQAVTDGEALGKKSRSEQTYHYDDAIRVVAPN